MSNWFFDLIKWCSEFSVQERKTVENAHGTCHSEGATHMDVMAGKKKICGVRLESTATEESPVASCKRSTRLGRAQTDN